MHYTPIHVPLAEVLDTLGGEYVVVPLPGELSLHETLGGKALHGLNDLQVGDVELFVLRRIVVLLGDQDTLCISQQLASTPPNGGLPLMPTLEEVLVDDAPVLLSDNHAGRVRLEWSEAKVLGTIF